MAGPGWRGRRAPWARPRRPARRRAPCSPAHPAAGRTHGRTHRRTSRLAAHTRAPAPAAAAGAPGGGRPVTAPSQSAPRRVGGGDTEPAADTDPRTPTRGHRRPPPVRTLALARPTSARGLSRRAPSHGSDATRHRDPRTHPGRPRVDTRGHTLSYTRDPQAHAPPQSASWGDAHTLVHGQRLRGKLRSTSS